MTKIGESYTFATFLDDFRLTITDDMVQESALPLTTDTTFRDMGLSMPYAVEFILAIDETLGVEIDLGKNGELDIMADNDPDEVTDRLTLGVLHSLVLRAL